MQQLAKSKLNLSFDNSFARLPEAFYRRVEPTPLPAPYLISFNRDAAALLDINPDAAHTNEFIETFIGNRVPEGAEPLAAIYAGHQFGSFVPQLGDGRAILLGEVKNKNGARWDVQLKGAGKTPFSRFGDGRAVLRSTIREYLCSEAIHHLGIPTTRALSIIGSDAPIQRETIETAAVLTRLAPTHVRFGSFELFHHRNQPERVTELADYVIREHYPELNDKPDRYTQFLTEITRRTARLMAQWQAVGWTHGVMNTDNMSIIGLTIDYGPYGFMDDYDPNFIPNHSDYNGRYAYSQQPRIGIWNLVCLAYTLLHLIPQAEAQAALDTYQHEFAEAFGELMRDKFGFSEIREGDAGLVAKSFEILAANHVDYTTFFRRLGNIETTESETAHTPDAVRDLFIDLAAFDAWAQTYRTRLTGEGSDDDERRERMNRVNPKYILRNYLAENAIRKATDERDYTEVDRLLELLRRPFDEQSAMETYAAPPPDWGKHLVISCSS
ncbi:MAG: YdiU family protein [Pyrinomonadaceae bacterium MAG19_C2-C3]|nr:YdiU family protein [Pyrinomonadaceae bacterium MAG19_C2-C3]